MVLDPGESEAEVDLAAGVHRLARPDLQPIVQELARRFSDGATVSAITLRDLSPGQRRAIADLLGMDRLPPARLRLSVGRLIEALGMEATGDLRHVVERLTGPIVDRRAQTAIRQAERDALWRRFEAEVSGIEPPGPYSLDPWVESVRVAGIRGGIADHERRLIDALHVLRNLPVDEGITLTSLAADVLHDAHALDRGTAVATLVLDAIAVATGAERATDAASARALWESVGVVPDPLSSTVLALGLEPAGDSPTARWLRDMASAGEPATLTLAQLRRWPLMPLPPDATAVVFENPALIAEASARGWDGPPLICSSGRPTIAVVTLLRQLGAEGATLAQHADFDPVGLAIAAWLRQRAGTTPWMMTAHDYDAACASRRPAGRVAAPVPETPWDPQLQRLMEAEGLVIHEEQLREVLLSAARRLVHSG